MIVNDRLWLVMSGNDAGLIRIMTGHVKSYCVMAFYVPLYLDRWCDTLTLTLTSDTLITKPYSQTQLTARGKDATAPTTLVLK